MGKVEAAQALMILCFILSGVDEMRGHPYLSCGWLALATVYLILSIVRAFK